MEVPLPQNFVTALKSALERAARSEDRTKTLEVPPFSCLWALETLTAGQALLSERSGAHEEARLQWSAQAAELRNQVSRLQIENSELHEHRLVRAGAGGREGGRRNSPPAGQGAGEAEAERARWAGCGHDGAPPIPRGRTAVSGVGAANLVPAGRQVEFRAVQGGGGANGG